MKKIVQIIVLLFCLVSAVSLQANPSALLENIKEITLDNGMKFLLLRREGAPVFSAYLRVKVGGIDEPEGKTGIAHMLEHMAFKGTSSLGTHNAEAEKQILNQIEKVYAQLLAAPEAKKSALALQMKKLIAQADRYVKKEEFTQIYSRNGASNLNATTSQDLTSYFVNLPNTKLRLWAYLESQRLKDPVFREFYTERDVVKEERRMRSEDSPTGKLYESLMDIAFEKSPYRRPTIGYPEDLSKLSATELHEFYQKYYRANNITVALVGNLDRAETEKVIREYFSDFPKTTQLPPLQVDEPKPQEAKKVVIEREASPALMAAYLKPNMPHRDDYVFDVLEQILCEGPSSRLYKRLVEKERLAQTVDCSASTPGSRLENIFLVYLSLAKDSSSDVALKVLEDEFSKIAKGGVNADELKRAKKNLNADWYYDLQSNEEMAELLSYFEAIAGSWRYILEHQKQIESVSSKDIARVVKTYLKPERLRLGILERVKKKS